MKISKTHVFNAPIEKVWAMFTDETAHVAKFESMGHAKIEVLEADITDDGFRIVVSRDVTLELPSFAKKVLQPTNTVVSTDRWTAADDGTYGGTFAAETRGAPVDVKGTTRLEPDGDDRTTYTVSTEVKVKVPLIGGKIEKFFEGDIRKQIDDEFACGDAWLTTH